MKTAISIPDDLYESADAVAAKLGLSRSALYAHAIAEYVAKFADEELTARLNAVYAEQPASRDRAVREAAKRTIRRSEW